MFKIGVIYDIEPVPPAKTTPPVASAYQSTVVPNAAPVTLIFTVPVLHLLAFTATKLFESANWMERETYDFYGINFVGHPNLIRILNVDDMDYHPMRKEYPLEDATRHDKIDEMFGR